MNLSLLKNPFIRYAGGKAVFIGLVILVASAGLASLFNLHYDGLLDAHYSPDSTPAFLNSILEQVINALSFLLVFYPIALMMGARNTRLVDLTGTYLVSRAPLLLLPLLNINQIMSNIGVQMIDNVQSGNDLMPKLSGNDWLIFGLNALIMIAAIALYIHFLFQAWRTCTNIKGTRLIISFISGLFTAEIISKIAHIYLF
jgi:hypothetical protein